jgi:hypothetical protein
VIADIVNFKYLFSMYKSQKVRTESKAFSGKASSSDEGLKGNLFHANANLYTPSTAAENEDRHLETIAGLPGLTSRERSAAVSTQDLE